MIPRGSFSIRHPKGPSAFGGGGTSAVADLKEWGDDGFVVLKVCRDVLPNAFGSRGYYGTFLTLCDAAAAEPSLSDLLEKRTILDSKLADTHAQEQLAAMGWRKKVPELHLIEIHATTALDFCGKVLNILIGLPAVSLAASEEVIAGSSVGTVVSSSPQSDRAPRLSIWRSSAFGIKAPRTMILTRLNCGFCMSCALRMER